MQLATHLRAPFIAPGRRNRKVHWNRPLSRAIASLGKFEREDWRRALWLPESLRGFYPKWNNQFSPGGGSGCGCCGGYTGDCVTVDQCLPDGLATTAEITLPFFAASPSYCADLEGTYIMTMIDFFGYRPRYVSEDWFGAGIDLRIEIVFGCNVDGQCFPQINVIAFGLLGNPFVQFEGVAYTGFPWELPYDATFPVFPCTSPTDPAYINSISGWG